MPDNESRRPSGGGPVTSALLAYFSRRDVSSVIFGGDAEDIHFDTKQRGFQPLEVHKARMIRAARAAATQGGLTTRMRTS